MCPGNVIIVDTDINIDIDIDIWVISSSMLEDTFKYSEISHYWICVKYHSRHDEVFGRRYTALVLVSVETLLTRLFAESTVVTE